jgi:HEAT repeat protein
VWLDADVLDEAVTLRTIAVGGIDRSHVLALADRRRESGEVPSIDFGSGETVMWGTQTIVTRRARDTVASTTRAAGTPAVSVLLSEITDLHSADSRRIRKALRSGARLDRHLVPHVISLFARDDVTDDAVRVLREVGDRATGQVVDAMLDQGVDPIIRRRLPQVLAGSGSPIAILGLLHALNDSELDVRFRAAGALVRTREAHPDRMVPHDAIFRAALAEIGRSTVVLRQASDPAHSKSVELVFRILSLALEPEPLNLAQRAFRGTDPHLRGTALEYLETVLPADIVEALRPLVGPRSSPTARTRTVKELESELLASSVAVSIDVAALRRGLRQRAADDPGDRPIDD